MIVLESTDEGYPGKRHYGMSSAKGDKLEKLPKDNVPQGSDCFDYTTRKVYFYDGVSWN